jgi:hypothetical protein
MNLGLMHSYDSSSRVSPEYSLTELFIQFPPLQMSIIKSGNVYPRHRVACVLIEQKSAQEVVLSLVTVLRVVRCWTSRLILRKAGRLPIEKGLHLDATEEGRKDDQSKRVDILTTSLTPAVKWLNLAQRLIHRWYWREAGWQDNAQNGKQSLYDKKVATLEIFRHTMQRYQHEEC